MELMRFLLGPSEVEGIKEEIEEWINLSVIQEKINRKFIGLIPLIGNVKYMLNSFPFMSMGQTLRLSPEPLWEC